MEKKDLKDESIEVKVETKNKKNPLLLIIILVIIIGLCGFIYFNKSGKADEIKVKSTLEKVVEKSELQTISYTYNFIAKKCKKEKCDLKSNKISDFEMAVSCKGKLNAGIDIKKIQVDLDDEKKKLIIKLPDATLSNDPDIISYNILNGDELGSGATATAHNLCEDIIIEKSKNDAEILKNANEQARTVLEKYYESWIKAYDDSYSLEIK